MIGPEHPRSRWGVPSVAPTWGSAGKACREAPSRRLTMSAWSASACAVLNRQARPCPSPLFPNCLHCLSACGLPEPPPWLPSVSSSGRDPWLSDCPRLPLRCDCAWQTLLSSLTILSSALYAAGSPGESPSHSRMALSRSPQSSTLEHHILLPCTWALSLSLLQAPETHKPEGNLITFVPELAPSPMRYHLPLNSGHSSAL